MWSVSPAQQDQGKVLYTLPKPPQAASLALPGFLLKDLMKIDKECQVVPVSFLIYVKFYKKLPIKILVGMKLNLKINLGELNLIHKQVHLSIYSDFYVLSYILPYLFVNKSNFNIPLKLQIHVLQMRFLSLQACQQSTVSKDGEEGKGSVQSPVQPD